MNEPPNRTKITSLTDDELLLFDLLFDGYHSSDALGAGVYAEYLNVGYTHSISDAELTDLVMDLESRRLVWKKVVEKNGQSRTLLTLSDAGFQLWELERNPDWGSFVITSQRELGLFASGSLMIYCMDETIGRQCGGALFASGQVTPISGMHVRQIGSRRLLPGKSFDGVLAIRFRTKDRVQNVPKHIDWSVYHQSRCWWRWLGEMQHKPKCPDIPTKHAKPSTSGFGMR